MSRLLSISASLAVSTGLFAGFAIAQAPPTKQGPPTRDPHTAGYVTAKELPDGAIPRANADGNFIIGPTHTPRRRWPFRKTCRRERSTTSPWARPTARSIPASRGIATLARRDRRET